MCKRVGGKYRLSLRLEEESFYHIFNVVLVVVVVEITLLTSILSGVTWTVAYSGF